MNERKVLSRRALLGGVVGTAAAALLAACGGAAATTSTGAGSGGAAPTQANPFGSAAPTATKPATSAAPASAAPSTAASSAPGTRAAASATTAGASTAPPSGGAITSTGKMTYWGGLIFSDDANNLLSSTVKEWGKQNKIEIDVVMINQNETNTKVAAAVESNTMPDALDMGLDLMLLLSNTKKLTPLDDLYTKIGSAQGGWLKGTEEATAPAKFGGTRNGIPFGVSGNLLFSRKDVLQKAGVQVPTTWEELSAAAEKVTKPPLYGMGLALSNVGDGNLQVSVLQSWGGRIASDDGKTVTLKSPETKAYLEWVSGAYKKGLFPPGSTTWDGAGDNNAYLAGQAVFIANTGSVAITAQANKDTELVNNTGYSSLPRGPKMKISSFGPNVRAIPVGGKNIDASKALLEYLSNPEFLNKYYKVAIYGPVLQNQAKFDAFADPIRAGLLDLAQNGTAPGFPDVSNTAYADFNNNYIVPKMVQRVVIDNYDLDRAIDEAQKAGEAIYAKYK
jgi:multiple sugar transport system substrate-binding protein